MRLTKSSFPREAVECVRNELRPEATAPSGPPGILRTGRSHAETAMSKCQVVAVVPRKLDGVFAYTFGREGLGGGLEHGERTGGRFWRFAGPASGFVALFVAHGARAGIAEVDEAVVGAVAVFPFDIQAGSGREIDLYRFRVRGRGGSLERGLHEVSIA